MTMLQPFPRSARFPVIASLAFILDSKPASLNETYGTQAVPDGKGGFRGKMYMRKVAGDRKETIRRGAQFTLMSQSAWPRDVWACAHVRFSMYVFNVRAGTDAANEVKLAADACQGVLYENDNVVSIGEIPRPEKDGYEPGARVEYVFDLLEMRTPLQARKYELDTLATRRQRLMTDVLKGNDIAARMRLQEVEAAFAVCQAKIAALLKDPKTNTAL